jgi:hypothetical protein
MTNPQWNSSAFQKRKVAEKAKKQAVDKRATNLAPYSYEGEFLLLLTLNQIKKYLWKG